MKKRIHHAYIGIVLLFWCILTLNGIATIGEFNIYVWVSGLILGMVLVVHDVWWHLTHRK